MRIALLAPLRHPIRPPFMGGLEAHCWHLARGLKARGHQVTLFASGDSDVGVPVFPVLRRHARADFPDPARQGGAHLAAILDAAMQRACDRIAQGGFDVVHDASQHPRPLALAARGQPCVTALHGPPAPALQRATLDQTGARFTHHSSIAPTGTISLSLANNASNGIEPSFAHHYSRNLIRPGRKRTVEQRAQRELEEPRT